MYSRPYSPSFSSSSAELDFRGFIVRESNIMRESAQRQLWQTSRCHHDRARLKHRQR